MEAFKINDAFKQLENKKQEKILKAAFLEFGEKGYEKASTNTIIKNAEISKGMLFYYFNSKKELYHDLVDYGIEYIKREYLSLIDYMEEDYIEKYRKASVLKMKAYYENPEIFEFFSQLYLNQDSAISEEVTKKIMDMREFAFSNFFSNIDTSLFRSDIPKERIIQLIGFCMDGYEKSITEKVKVNEPLSKIDLKPYWDDFYNYLDDLKTIFYVREGN